MPYESIEEFANSSPQAHALLDRVIDTRAAEAARTGARLKLLNPYEGGAEACDRPTYQSLKKDFESFKNKTASLVEAHVESKYYRPAYGELPPGSSVGQAIPTASFEPDSVEWLHQRYDTVGGSDVGVLAVMDFTPESEVMYWDRASLKTVANSKTKLMTPEEIAERNRRKFGGKGGALYRGAVWETRSRDRFVADNPGYRVLNTKDQFVNPSAPWQQVNFDGVLSDREDGQINGILELKTGNDPAKWEKGVPLNYRAQVLYYLNASKLDYAMVGACLNDGEFRYFRLGRHDSVAPGVYDKPMSTYIKERVEPWFLELKAGRAVA